MRQPEHPIPKLVLATKAVSLAGSLIAALLFADRIVAGFVQCASAGSCPW